MTNLKCPNCGADLTTDEAQSTGKCPYCNSRFAEEKKEEPKEFEQTATINTDYTTINNSKKTTDSRPRIKFGILILFLFINPFLFMGYIIITEIRKKAWDIKHIND